jgi:hypothetical protein
LPFFARQIDAGLLTPLQIKDELPRMNIVMMFNSLDLLSPAARELAQILKRSHVNQR